MYDIIFPPASHTRYPNLCYNASPNLDKVLSTRNSSPCKVG